jgi:hypothetical protein
VHQGGVAQQAVHAVRVARDDAGRRKAHRLEEGLGGRVGLGVEELGSAAFAVLWSVRQRTGGGLMRRMLVMRAAAARR